MTLRLIVDRSLRTARSFSFRDRCCRRKWWVICGEVLYQVTVIFIHDADLFDNPMHFSVETL